MLLHCAHYCIISCFLIKTTRNTFPYIYIYKLMKTRVTSCTTMMLLMWITLIPITVRAEGPKPNILFISIDDLNDWIGCLGGHPQTITPNLDRQVKSSGNQGVSDRTINGYNGATGIEC